MKTLPVSLVIFFLAVVSLNSCRSTCDQTVYYFSKIPVYSSLESIRSEFNVTGPQQLDTIVRIVELDHAYFLEEKGKGVHVVDKSTNPIKRVAFIEMIGCLSIEAIGNTLYVGQATDLVSIDVSDLNNISKKHTVKGLFNGDFVKQDSFITGYREEYIEREIIDGDCADSYIYPENTSELVSVSNEPQLDLHISNSHVNVCDNKTIFSFAIGSGSTPSFRNSQQFAGQSFVTNHHISSTADFLVVGSPRSSMMIMRNDGTLTRVVSSFVSSPFTCGRFFLFDDAILYPDFSENPNRNCNSINALHIHPINGATRPFSPFQFSFAEPQYLSIADSTMLLCNGSGGFVLFDISTPSTFNVSADLLDEVTTFHCAVSALSKERALIWGRDGLFYVNVSDPRNVGVIGKIE